MEINNDHSNSDKQQKLEQVIAEVKVELQNMFTKKKILITKLGEACEKVAKKEDICEEIKNVLKNEIVEGLISKRLIERYCPSEWKKKRRPEKELLEKDKISLSESKQISTPILIDNSGREVLEDKGNNWRNEELSDQNGILEEVDMDKWGQSIANKKNNCISFEFFFHYNTLQDYMAREFKEHKGTKPIFIHGTMDITTGKIVAFSLGERNESIHTI